MKITRLGSGGLPASCPAPHTSEMQGTDLPQTQSKDPVLRHCSPPASPKPSSRAEGGGPPNGVHSSLELHTVSAEGGEGGRRGGLALGQARQEGGGGGGILRPLEDQASAMGRETAPRPSAARRLGPTAPPKQGGSFPRRRAVARSSRRGQASGSPAPRGPARRHAQAAPSPSLGRGARRAVRNREEGPEPGLRGAGVGQAVAVPSTSRPPHPAGGPDGARGGPMEPEEAP